jgi:acetyl-CoA carboxylase biotin carboxylase subunit
VDTHCYEGYRVSPNYDSLLAKLIVRGCNREEAIRNMIQALQEFEIRGVSNLISWHLALMRHPRFIAGDYHTLSVEKGEL